MMGMKRIFSVLFALCIVFSATCCLSSCDGGNGAKDETTEAIDADAPAVDIDITETTFKGWIKELESSPADYLGKTIRLEGVMYKFQADNGNTYNTVYRDGCCSGDHMYYLEFVPTDKLTAVNGDWIEVIGTFSNYYEDTSEYYTLKDAKVTVKTVRGTEQLGL